MSRAGPGRSGSAPAESCCRTIHRWSSPSRSARWNRSIPGGSISGAGVARRKLAATSGNFPDDVLELQALLGDVQPNQAIRAVPGMGTKVPLWILGSSTFGAQLAAMLGPPLAFASHFAPQMMMPALREYRARFEPSAQLDKPYAMIGVNVFAADSDAIIIC